MNKAFPKFVHCMDLGIVSWNPGPNANDQLKRFRATTVDDVLSRLDLSSSNGSPKDDSKDEDVEAISRSLSVSNHGPPRLNYSKVRTPLFFKNLPPQEYPNSFPNESGYVVPLCVAVSRGLSLANIDFVLGGSALEVLAHKRIDRRSGDNTKYLVQRVGNVIILAKSKRYTQNYADIAFQFERLVTGGRIEDQHDPVTTEHLHIMQLGDFKVLFTAEVDAMDEDGHCVEIKSGNPRYFGSKVMFQMIASGSRTLIQADKRGPQLLRINQRSIHDLVCEHPEREVKRMQSSILDVLEELKGASVESIGEDHPSELDFVGNKVVLYPSPESDLLPKRDVIAELLKIASPKGSTSA